MIAGGEKPCSHYYTHPDRKRPSLEQMNAAAQPVRSKQTSPAPLLMKSQKIRNRTLT